MGRARLHTESSRDSSDVHGLPRVKTERSTSVQVVGPEMMARAIEILLHSSGVCVVEKAADVVVFLPPMGSDGERGKAGCVIVTDGTDFVHRQPPDKGVWSLVGTSEPVSVLVAAIDAAARGEAYCSPQLLPMLLNAALDTPERTQSGVIAPAREELSRREREVAQLAADGQSNETIAMRLHISVATVKFHLFHVFRKLSVTRRSQLRTVLSTSSENE